MDSTVQNPQKDNNILIVAVIIVILLIIVGGAVAYVLSQNLPKNNTIQTPQAQQQTTTPVSSVVNQSKIVDASIANMAFPAEIRIKKGETIRWTNDDITAHTVTFSDLDLNSGILRQGEVFEHKFNDVGTFNYSCSLHPFMTGKVIVE